MTPTALGLAVVAVALLGPGPELLARARWARREPRAALVLWQSIGLAAGIAAIGALLALALAPRDASLPAALGSLLGPTGLAGLDTLHLALLGLAVAVLLWLIGVTASWSWRVHRCRRRQRELLDLVSTPWPHEVSPQRATGAGARVVEHPEAAAYCLPGGDSAVVVTTGALSLLPPAELDALLAHEHAHLAERHDLVLLPFAAWAVALFGLRGPRRARRAVQQLVEMVADDRACQGRDRAVLAAALARVGASGGGGSPAGALGSADLAVLPRVRRLLDPPGRSWRVRTAAYGTAALVVAVPAAVLLVPTLG